MLRVGVEVWGLAVRGVVLEDRVQLPAPKEVLSGAAKVVKVVKAVKEPSEKTPCKQ
jgi:hypothetical protein